MIERARVVVAETPTWNDAAAALSLEWGRVVSGRALATRMRRARPPAPPVDCEVEVLGEADLVPDAGPAPAPPSEILESRTAPAIHTSKTRGEAYLVISDLQVPFHLPNALAFVNEVRREFNVHADNILCVGDEVDNLFGSMFPKDPDGTHTPTSEIGAARDELRRWYAAFPRMRLCVSNHGMRWAKKASAAEIPSQMIRAYQEIIEAPDGWRWQDRWLINASKRPFQMEHGHEGAGGMYAYRVKAIENGISTVFGHLHANPGIAHVNTAGGQSLWGCCAGSLIDASAYAFAYNRRDRFKPWIGCAVILDGGTTPLLVPYHGLGGRP